MNSCCAGAVKSVRGGYDVLKSAGVVGGFVTLDIDSGNGGMKMYFAHPATQTFDQINVPRSIAGNALDFLKEGDVVQVLAYGEEALAVFEEQVRAAGPANLGEFIRYMTARIGAIHRATARGSANEILGDIHSATALRIFGVEPKAVTPSPKTVAPMPRTPSSAPPLIPMAEE